MKAELLSQAQLDNETFALLFQGGAESGARSTMTSGYAFDLDLLIVPLRSEYCMVRK